MKKRILFTFLILVVGLVAFCGTRHTEIDPNAPTTCTSASCPLHHPVITVPTTYMESVSKDNISLTLPNPGWNKKDVDDDTVLVAELNEEQACMLRLIKEPTNDTYPKYTVSVLRDFTSLSLSFRAFKQVVINKQNFVVTENYTDGRVAWFWTTTKNGYGYWLMCGCSVHPGAKQFEMCKAIAESLEIR